MLKMRRYSLGVAAGAIAALFMGNSAPDGVILTMDVALQDREQEGFKTLMVKEGQTASEAASQFLTSHGVMNEEAISTIVPQLAHILHKQLAARRTEASRGTKLVLPVDFADKELYLEHTFGKDVNDEVTTFCEGDGGLQGGDVTECVTQLRDVLVDALAAHANARAAAAAKADSGVEEVGAVSAVTGGGGGGGGRGGGDGGDGGQEEPLFSMPVTVPAEVTGTEVTEQLLSYLTSQTPAEAASAFCDNILPKGSEPTHYASCIVWAGDTINLILKEMSEMNLNKASGSATVSKPQRSIKANDIEVAVEVEPAKEEDILYRVPVSVNNVETELQIVQGRSPRTMAVACCMQPAVGLTTGLTTADVADDDDVSVSAARDSCIVQLTELAAEVLKYIVQEQTKAAQLLVKSSATAATGSDGGGGRGGGTAAAATEGSNQQRGGDGEEEMSSELFNFPMRIGEKELMLSMKVGETTGSCAERFCAEQKTAIYAAMVARGLPAGPDLFDHCVNLVKDATSNMLLALEADIAKAEARIAQAEAEKEEEEEEKKEQGKAQGAVGQQQQQQQQQQQKGGGDSEEEAPILVIDVNSRMEGGGGSNDDVGLLGLKVYRGDSAHTASRRFIDENGLPIDILDQLTEAVAREMMAAGAMSVQE